MTLNQLYDLTSESIIQKIQAHIGLRKFVERRAKFEGWLKVELTHILAEQGYDAFPEIDRIDVSFDNVAIELKTLNTNIRYENVINTTRPITNNTNGVVLDIEKLRNKNYQHKFVIFIVFPITHENQYWQIQLERITDNLEEYRFGEFNFIDNIPGVIYYGKI